MGKKHIHNLRFDGQDRTLVTAPVSGLGWNIVLAVDQAELRAPLKALTQRSVGLIALTLVLLAGAILWVTQSINRPILNMVGLVHEIANGDGDLSRRITLNQQGELGRLAQGFNQFIENLHGLVSGVLQNAAAVGQASGEIRMVSQAMANDAADQSVQSGEVSASVQEMAATLVQNAKNASEGAAMAERTSGNAKEGESIMRASYQSMEEIVSMTAKTEALVTSLSQRAEQVGKVAVIIDDIADQTNLLALNAAIEAARAGEQGRGFAVVADEVRKLAERTTQATGEIAETIEAIQKDTLAAVGSMQDANRQVKSGQELIQKTQAVFQAISQDVVSTQEMVRQIAVATEEMGSGATEMSRHVASMDQVSRKASDNAQRLAATAGAMASESEALSQALNRFKL